MVNLMNSEIDGPVEADQARSFERLSARLTTWAAFTLLLAFLIVTVALWGYAAWWGLMKLISLFA